MICRGYQRIRLLNEHEIKAIYCLPSFTEAERHHYFSLSSMEESELKGMHLPSRIHFILQLGFFRAKHLLFDFTFNAVRDDVKYVLSRHFLTDKFPNPFPSRNSLSSNNQRILALNNFTPYSSKIKNRIDEKLSQSIRHLNNPMEMLRELLQFMEHEKIVLPSYSTLQDLIGAAIMVEEERINDCVTQHVTKKTMILIDKLFTIKEDETFYDLTLLKHYPKNFNFKMIQAELDKHKSYYPLYRFAKRFLSKLELSEQNIAYYGSLVEHYQIQALRRFVPARRYLYLLCYAYHRFQKMDDQFIETLAHYVNAYNKDAKEYAKIRAGEVNTDIKTQHGKPAKTLIYWYFDKSLSKLVFGEIQKRALDVLSKDNMIVVGEFLANDDVDKKRYEWEFHDNNFQAMIKNIRPLIKVLNFQTDVHNRDLLEGLQFLKDAVKNNRSLNDIDISEFPLDTIPSHLKQYLIERDQEAKGKIKPVKSVHLHRYEFYIYDQLNKNIAANKVYANDTTQYKNFSDDIKLKKTSKEKKQLLNSLDAPRLNRDAISLLNELEEELEARIITTNENIAGGKNKYIKIKGTGDNRTWTLPYKKKSDAYNNPFYDKLPITNLIEVMLAVNDEFHYINAFTNIKLHYAKTKNDIRGIIACIIANATNLGTYKMSASSDFTYSFLLAIEQNLIRLETLREANDLVSARFAKLPIYPYYHLDNLLHGSADGQKFKTRWETFQSRHSPKYYGLDKGVAPYTLGINFNAVNCIADKGAHQHESHFLFELILSNTSGIDVDRLSTDTEGSNQIMFALMYFANIDYTPCYRNLRKKANKICGFKNPGDYPSDYLIKPFRKVNKKLIIEEWENIQDIVMAILSKETSVSVITRKLCSNELKGKTKRALWELNNILRSIYLLRYIDDIDLRRFVRAALNRIEAYHLLRKNIGETNGSSFRGGSDVEVAIWNECARLVANVIMYYNASLLSKLMLIKEQKGDAEGVKFIQYLSPIASQHLNFGGYYEFKKSREPINIEEMINMMDKIDISNMKVKKKN
jgi:TnpA family transposase